ncbi:hypothetical protein [Hymenobacter sp. DG25A]|uniref:hypothetical protein n=1 Tax=Hymenobacter sp. DG25A TaxID=1385663 RepID=UPI0006BDB9F2|nr:hypothetical protein [Hymenobacter sp. DG25A]ALD20682.1 hypothetical protein AM218_04915 [Hymenobacter sp. DG25A]
MKRLVFCIFLFFIIYETFSQTNNTIFSFTRNEKEIIKSNKIIKEEVYSYTLYRKGIKDSTLVNVYYYNPSGDVIEEKSIDKKTHQEYTTKYQITYNNLEKPKKEIIKKETLKLIFIQEHGYDDQGNETYMYDYNEDTTRLIIDHKTYNAKNQLIQLQKKINNNEFYTSSKYYYNNDGKLSKSESFDISRENIYTYTYDYDKLLNKKITYLENSDGRKKISEIFYNNDNQIIKNINNSNSFTNYSASNKFGFTSVNTYNSNKTISESNFYINNKKSQMNRHFYFKK